MDDPFGSVAKKCCYSNSQQDRFRHSTFCRESEFFSGDDSPESDGIPVDSTGVVILSEEDDDSTPHDEFQTPPEETLPVAAGSNEQQVNVDDGCTDAAGTGVLGYSVNVDREVSEFEAEKFRVLQRGTPPKEGLGLSESKEEEEEGLSVPPSKKQKHSCDLNFGSEVSGGVLGVGEGTVKEGLGTTSNGERFGADNLVQNKLKYVESSGLNGDATSKGLGLGLGLGLGGRRELPSSIRGQAADISSSKNQQLMKSLAVVLEMLRGERDCSSSSSPSNVDILETVKRRGMTFPRPRWRRED